ncbi:MAG: YtrH family sporulation protein [Bacilli bacterium]
MELIFIEKLPFIPQLIVYYFIALGVLLGGSFIGAFGAFIIGEPPLAFLTRLASSLRIWALVAAIGGTFDTFYSFERSVFQGELDDIIKQFIFILSAMAGAQTGMIIISWLAEDNW